MKHSLHCVTNTYVCGLQITIFENGKKWLISFTNQFLVCNCNPSVDRNMNPFPSHQKEFRRRTPEFEAEENML